jgi:hexosaminidase
VNGPNGRFTITEQTKIVLSAPNDDELIFIALQLKNYIQSELSITVNIESTSDLAGSTSVIYLVKSSLESIDEKYSLIVNKDSVEIEASSYAGVFYGMQSLKQQLLSSNELNLIRIEDAPQYSYRGLMLDVSRHFFTVDEIKQTLDLMALYKFNTFHWHLTDDQGWRIEIKQYPLLTDIGSYRHETILDKNFDPFIGDGIPHFGFYSQDDIREVVQYAKERYITIIPEIDMPGHMQSALAAYPELACTSGPFDVSTRWGVHKDIMCPSEATFEFVENVLAEIITLFPSQYIHIGGDEVPTTRWQSSDIAQQVMHDNNLVTEHELQGYFYERVAGFLKNNNRLAIGWDEIIEKNIAIKTTVMAWRDLEYAENAAKIGHQVILTPTDFTYLNYYQDNQSTEPLAQCCMVTLEKVYDFSLELAGLKHELQELVIGGQASLWSEYIKTQTHLEYMMLPRMLALSEVLWTNSELHDISKFKEKLPWHFSFFEKIGVNFKESDVGD